MVEPGDTVVMEPRVTQKTTATNLTRVEMGEIYLLKGTRLPVLPRFPRFPKALDFHGERDY
jgi:hypothetical protein